MIIKIKNRLDEDIRRYFLLLPIFWALGVEQLIYPIIIICLFFKRSLIHGMVFKKNSGLYFFVLWVCIAFFSVITIEESYRYVTWVRNFLVLLTGLLLSYIVYEAHDSVKKVKSIVVVVAVLGVINSLAGFTAVIGMKFDFTSPVGAVLVKLSNSGYLQQMSQRSFSFMEALWFEAGFNRPRGLMLYPNLLGGILIACAILKFTLLGRIQQRSSVVLWPIFIVLWAVDAIVIIYTLSRSAWIGGFSAVLLLFFIVRMGVRQKLALSFGLCVIVGAAMYMGADQIMEKRFVEKGHSNEERGKNYELIYRALIDNPVNFLVGHGTQRDTPDLLIPLGSHSTYLGIAYKYGVLGLVFSLSGIGILYARVIRALKAMRDSEQKKITVGLLAAFTVITFQGMFIELDVDAVYGYFWWLFLGLLMSLTRQNFRTSDVPVALDSSRFEVSAR